MVAQTGRRAPVDPDANLDDWSRRLKKVDQLIIKATKEKTILVLITLAMPPIQQLPADDVWKEMVARVQDEFIQRYPRLSKMIETKLEMTPTLYINADAQMLSQLKYERRIAGIDEDKFLSVPSIQEQPNQQSLLIKKSSNLNRAFLPAGSNQVIAVIDSGVDKSHRAFAGKVVRLCPQTDISTATS